MEAAFLAHRAELLAFFRARDVQDASEDLLHDMWMRLPRDGVSIDAPLSYLYRMAETLVINRYHREKRDRQRDRHWSEMNISDGLDRSEQPGADRVLESRQAAAQTLSLLAGQGPRAFRIFCRHRIDGLTQREVAAEMGLSIGTIEGDLRRIYRTLAFLRGQQ